MDIEAFYAALGLTVVVVAAVVAVAFFIAKWIHRQAPPVAPLGNVRVFHCLDCGAEVSGTRSTCEDAETCWQRQACIALTSRNPWVVLLVFLIVPSLFGQRTETNTAPYVPDGVPTLNFLPVDRYPRIVPLTNGWTCIDLSASQELCVPPGVPPKQVSPVGMGSETNGAPYVSDDGMAHPSVCGGQGASCVVIPGGVCSTCVAHSDIPPPQPVITQGNVILPRNYDCGFVVDHWVCSEQPDADVTTYSNDVGGYVEP
jgi:hypothetical protein